MAKGWQRLQGEQWQAHFNAQELKPVVALKQCQSMNQAWGQANGFRRLKHYCLRLPVAVAVLLVAANTEARRWSDQTGRFSVDAEFVSLSDGTATLRKADGTTIRVPLERFCRADQEYALRLAEPRTSTGPAPSAAQSVPPKSRPSSSGADTAASQTVIADGSGTNPDEAIRDAFRNAVRQVVGAVVDEESLDENDEIIQDKVLTYSDGFITDYEEVPGSKTFDGGLHRIKIKAHVERRSVVKKLKSVNVTVREVHGKGLFAEVVTQLDAETSALSLLRKALQGFPQELLTARTIGKPEVVEKSPQRATVRILVQLEPDLNAYKTFAARLQLVLEKTAKDKGEFSAQFVPGRSPRGELDKSFSYFEGRLTAMSDPMAAWMPKAFSQHAAMRSRLNSDSVTVALTLRRSAIADRLEGRYFLFDKVVQPLLADVLLQKGTCKLYFLDASGQDVLTDRFPLMERVPWNVNYFEGTLVSAAGMSGDQHFNMLPGGNNEGDAQETRQVASLFWISPVFVQTRTNRIAQKPHLTLSRTVSLTLDELRSVQSVKCDVRFDN